MRQDLELEAGVTKRLDEELGRRWESRRRRRSSRSGSFFDRRGLAGIEDALVAVLPAHPVARIRPADDLEDLAESWRLAHLAAAHLDHVARLHSRMLRRCRHDASLDCWL